MRALLLNYLKGWRDSWNYSMGPTIEKLRPHKAEIVRAMVLIFIGSILGAAIMQIVQGYIYG